MPNGDRDFVEDLQPLPKANTANHQRSANISRQRGRRPMFGPRPAAPPHPQPPTVAQTSVANDENNLPEPSSQSTLKKQLLGPSVLKSGQDNVDQSRVAEIIYEASKGSKYFANESRKDLELTKRIDRILKKKAELDKTDTSGDLRKADAHIAALELERDLSQTIIHVDCDAFYASVEELDRPELKTVPMAVGKGVITTCNYEARKFGVRSGMAGHIATKLCPQLVFLPLNFEKYNAKAKEVREVLSRYDERFEAASCDEAYLNITSYLERHKLDPEEAVEKMRQEVFEHSKLTVSAGIAPNARIAKICSNKNKPNGQFRVGNDRSTVMSFMKSLPVRKVNGVGRVFERELEAVGIKTCGDIYPMRGLILKLFGQKAYEFLISVFLGLGRTVIRPAEEYIRKSIGSESTFPDLEGTANLREKLRKTAEALEEDLTKTELQGRTLALKVKMFTYEEAIRQKPLPYPIWKAGDVYEYALPLLTKLEEEYKPMKLRLMGLRMTNLSSRKKSGNGNDFFKPLIVKKRKFGTEAEEKWEEWPEEEWGKYNEAGFEIGREDDVEMDPDELKYFDGLRSDDLLGLEGGDDEEEEVGGEEETKDEGNGKEEVYWPCPICDLPQVAEDRTFNDHVDFCLSKQTIREAVREGDGERDTTPTAPPLGRASASASPEKATVNTVFKEYRQVGNHKNPLPSRRGRPRGKRRKL
ncbi:hypothetical protein TWF106_010255 [Orbilia oligospora]|uniref:DNA polymerase kappa n=1 Tax=Orbilia oligospora TaxID=2813651 RepID=A0A6G1MD52_ORBOL|nr:hypothetical protein TWF679_009863 [Orbilia oligospora]KAF3211370.1 hypothetical protein TWF106_010255 [Orbilia oligospora]KAF3219200.1 hypothetical protein TWF191_007994 [Orbilia oligospora]KAF3251824.1 hypothetical protein TWF192_004781 [Orbilia oligospora]